MKDVAKKAGVAVGTVSRFVNNKGGIKESTRKKVEKAIAELNFQPNEAARNFKTQQSKTIALIIPTIWHPFYSEFAYHVEREFSQKGYKTLLCNSQNDAEREINYITMLEKNKIDGIVAITYSKVIDQYISSTLPLVSIDRHFTEDVVTISSDNYAGGQLAAQVLVDRGCQHCAYMGSVSEIENESMLRSKGFQEYLEKQRTKTTFLILNEPVEDLEREIRQFLDVHPYIDGVFAMNDKWAAIVMNVLKEMGRQVPEDVQVIGYDGARMSKDALLTHSTIRQPIEEMAKRSVTELLNIIAGSKVNSKVVLPVNYFEGNSTKKP